MAALDGSGKDLNTPQNSRIASAAYLVFDTLLSLTGFRNGPHILVACMPKSGSTFLTQIVGKYEGFRRVRLIPTWGAREHELCQIKLSRYNHNRYVAQHHIRNSEWTQHLIAKYNLTTIVLVRDLFDVVVSLRDHIRKESREWPMAHFTQYHQEMDDAELEEAIVRLIMPWYMNFYAGWRSDPNALFVFYEDLTRAPEEAIAAVLKHSKLSPTPEKVKQALERGKEVDNRLNVGVSGRGKNISPRAAEDLQKLLDLYPEFEEDEYFKRMRAPRLHEQRS